MIADEADALAFGLNLVSDGRHVVLSSDATAFAAKLSAAGYLPVPVELSELKKGGDSLVARLPKDVILYTHCRSGVRSLAAGKILAERGFVDVRPLRPGYEELLEAGFKKAEE